MRGGVLEVGVEGSGMRGDGVGLRSEGRGMKAQGCRCVVGVMCVGWEVRGEG